MKKAVSWFNGLAGWLKTFLVIIISAILIFVCFVIYKAIRKAFGLVDDVTGLFGITDREATKVAKDDASSDAWSPDYYLQHGSEVHLTSAVIDDMASKIYDSWGWFSKDFDTTMLQFKKCKSKVDVSALVGAFARLYNKDLGNWLSCSYWGFNGFRLTDDQFLTLHNYVKSLPNE